MERLICLGIGYIFGMFQTGYLVGKSHHIDIRQCGSGNAGTTNALRTLGKKAGAITLLGDMFKCVLAILLIDHLFKNNYQDILPLLGMYTAAGCVLGHNFPFYLHFKGGKGVAASAGMLLALDWKVFLIAAGVSYLVLYDSLCISRFYQRLCNCVDLFCGIWSNRMLWHGFIPYCGDGCGNGTDDRAGCISPQIQHIQTSFW